ncbi:MAG: SDR family oxidoreductase [Acidimicrobiales bacterium]
MELAGKVAIVTGGAGGIGAALCRQFAEEGAAAVVVADLSGEGAAAVAREVSLRGSRGVAARTDVSQDLDMVALVERTESQCGPVDLLCCNAGIAVSGGVETPDDQWQRIWEVNVMAHVRAVRAVLPGMLARGQGYILHTASAAGLLTNLGAAPYAVTKHAVVALAEWLAITHGDAGIKVSCLCPQGVRTPMLLGGLAAEGPGTGGPGTGGPGTGGTGGPIGASAVLASGRMIEPEDVAEAVVAGLRDERFLILPHPEVAAYERQRAGDRDRWLAGMRRLQAGVSATRP